MKLPVAGALNLGSTVILVCIYGNWIYNSAFDKATQYKVIKFHLDSIPLLHII